MTVQAFGRLICNVVVGAVSDWTLPVIHGARILELPAPLVPLVFAADHYSKAKAARNDISNKCTTLPSVPSVTRLASG